MKATPQLAAAQLLSEFRRDFSDWFFSLDLILLFY